MLAKLCFTLKCTEEKQISINMASVFQGMLMELLDEETGDWLHRQERHPYSQNIWYDKEQIYWTIATLTKEAYERMMLPLLEYKAEQFHCEYHQVDFVIVKKEILVWEEQEFLEEYYFKNYFRNFTIEFVTPTSFKTNGKYVNYPSIRWIFQSLMNKYDACGGGNQIYDEEMLQLIEEQVIVTQYKLRSTFFYLEGIKIPSYKGTIKICVKGTQSTVNLVHFLLRYGEFSGIGIKSAIGMGAIKVQSSEKKSL